MTKLFFVVLKFSVIIVLYFSISKAEISKKFAGINLICNGKYQIIGYEFIDEDKVIRRASSKTDDDYYDNMGSYNISSNFIHLDIEGDLFKREISIETLELFIGVHSNNKLVGKCDKFYGDLDKYFKK